MNVHHTVLLAILLAGCGSGAQDASAPVSDTSEVSTPRLVNEGTGAAPQESDPDASPPADTIHEAVDPQKLSPEVAAAVSDLARSLKAVGSYDYMIRGEGIDAFRRAMDRVRKLKAEQAALPALVDVLENGTKGAPPAAAYVLGRFGAKAKSAVPALIWALDSEDAHLRVQAAGALWRVDRKGALVVQLLVDVVEDERDTMYHGPNRVLAAKYLGEMGAEAKDVVPILINVVKEKPIRRTESADDSASRAAGEALRKIEPEAEARALAELFKDENRGILRLYELGAGAAPVVPELLEALQHENQYVRETAAAALGNVGPQAKEAVPALVAALDDNWRGAVATALIALEKIAPDDDAVQAAITKAFENPHCVAWSVKQIIAKIRAERAAIGQREDELSPEVAAVVAELLSAAPAEHQSSHGPFTDPVGEAIDRLREMDGVEQALPTIVQAIGEYPKGRRPFPAFTVIFAYLGDEAKAAVPQLIERFKKGRRHTRQTVVRIFEEIGPDAQSAVPLLIDALGDSRIHGSVAHTLGEIGPAAKAAIPALEELSKIESSDWGDVRNVRAAARSALKKIRRATAEPAP